MWMTLLLIAQASCEWVEISQHHYRKSIRTHQEYANQTVAPHTWTDRNVGITRIETSSAWNKYGMDDRNTFTRDVTAGIRNKEFIGTVEKLLNKGVIRRVQLPNTQVKSPTVMETTSASDQLYTNLEISLENASEELPQRIYKNRKQHVDTTVNEFDTQVTKVTIKNYSLVNDNESNHNEYEKEYQIATETTTHQELDQNSRKPDIALSGHDIINYQYRNPNNEKLKPLESGDNVSTLNIEEEKESHEYDSTEETQSVNNKANTIEVLVKFMKTVAEIISKNSHKSLRSKMRYLHELKNTMLDNIENRIDMLWPDDDTDPENGAKRRARSANDSARGHVEFPSSESALMTISFLTFAVFLIKLVLQVIQTYKNKTMMVAPLVVATAGRAAVQRLRDNYKQNN
ncbi:uncharacterized protein LOC115449581 [Manduca sexta]|uniref:uncharacterized protein LOC115449581 n=1 Tax=Manduca sexta TaxID=7130 RepID=UPI00188E438E|nr:uncharacterized protein LOC115449581 [Manduca sexta]